MESHVLRLVDDRLIDVVVEQNTLRPIDTHLMQLQLCFVAIQTFLCEEKCESIYLL